MAFEKGGELRGCCVWVWVGASLFLRRLHKTVENGTREREILFSDDDENGFLFICIRAYFYETNYK